MSFRIIGVNLDEVYDIDLFDINDLQKILKLFPVDAKIVYMQMIHFSGNKSNATLLKLEHPSFIETQEACIIPEVKVTSQNVAGAPRSSIQYHVDLSSVLEKPVVFDIETTGLNYYSKEIQIKVDPNLEPYKYYYIGMDYSKEYVGTMVATVDTKNRVSELGLPNSVKSFDDWLKENRAFENAELTKYYNGEHYNTPVTLPELECEHEFKEYIGLTQRYNYCVKCDLKRE